MVVVVVPETKHDTIKSNQLLGCTNDRRLLKIPPIYTKDIAQMPQTDGYMEWMHRQPLEKNTMLHVMHY